MSRPTPATDTDHPKTTDPTPTRPRSASLPIQHRLETSGPHGALVYGLETHRDAVRRLWQPDISNPATSSHPFSKTTEMIDTKGLTTVDRYNNLTWREFPQRGTGDLGPFGQSARQTPQWLALVKRLQTFRIDETASLDSDSQQQAAKFQQGLLQHPRYSVFRTLQDDASTLMQKEGYSTPELARFRSQTIRACKFGIEYGQLPGKRVLFELGDMDSTTAPLKTPVGRKNQQGLQTRSITSAELRKAFRHDLSDDSLQFFRKGQPVAAPWASGNRQEQQAWAQYAFGRLDKYQRQGFTLDHSKFTKDMTLRQGYREMNAQMRQFKQAQRDKHALQPPLELPKAKL